MCKKFIRGTLAKDKEEGAGMGESGEGETGGRGIRQESWAALASIVQPSR